MSIDVFGGCAQFIPGTIGGVEGVVADGVDGWPSTRSGKAKLMNSRRGRDRRAENVGKKRRSIGI